jgi:Peroxin-3
MSGPSEINVANAALRRLLDETSDLIDSPAFTHVLTLLLDSAFSLLIDNKIATLAYKIPPPSASGARVVEIVGPGTDVKAKVASTLATFSRQAHSIGSGGNNEYLTAMENVRDLEAFAAVVYSSNFEFEAPEAAGLNASWEQVAAPSSESGTLRGTSTAGVTPAPSGMLTANDPEEEVLGDEESLIDVGEVDMEKAWWKATASPSSSPSKAKKEALKKESPKEEVKVEAPKEETKVEAPKIEAPKVETPKVETPKVETPKVETLEAETPQVEVPKIETAKDKTLEAEAPIEEVLKEEASKEKAPLEETAGVMPLN